MALIQEGRSEYGAHAWSEFDIFKAIAYVDSRFKFDYFLYGLNNVYFIIEKIWIQNNFYPRP